MSHYYRLILGKKHSAAESCVEQGFVGIDYDMPDLSEGFPSDEEGFYQKLESLYRADHPDASNVQVSLACGVINKFVHRIREGDFVVCPMGDSSYRVGEVVGGYTYVLNGILPHRRKVKWLLQVLRRPDMSEGLRGSLGGALTIIGPDSITRHQEEIGRLLGGEAPPSTPHTDPDVEDPVAFAMEKHLEEFLVRNWQQTTLSLGFEILSEGEETIGQQFPTDVGPIDILAVSKDKSRLLVIELKRGRASDVVVGQLLRYMGFVKGKVAEPHQSVEGLVIALQNDHKLKWALSALPNLRFLRYQINFNLIEE
jgi:restriction system protein